MGHLQVDYFLQGKSYNYQCYVIVINEISCKICTIELKIVVERRYVRTS